MADDPNPALRIELKAALATLDPQIRGLEDYAAVSITTELRSAFTDQVSIRKQRRGLIQAVLNNLDKTLAAIQALEADGYPTLSSAELPAALFSEFQSENSDLASAIAIFAPIPPATTLTVELGEPAAKSNVIATKGN